MHIYPFHLEYHDTYRVFWFPFIDNGNAVSGPSCFLSPIEAGDMKFDPYTQNPHREQFFSTLAKRKGIEHLPVYAVKQVHSRNVVIVDGSSHLAGLEADGLVTDKAGLWLSVTVADCLPIYLRDRSGTYRAMLHSGWKGTGIVQRALAIFIKQWQVAPKDILAVLGPCICSECYKVDEERARQFEAEFGGSEGPFPLGPVVKHSVGPEGSNNYSLDLKAANSRLLAQAGVQEIAVCSDCTVCNTRLGSFRRQGPDSYTRMVALID
ncbi:MAG: polyphenol oxidase family protein [Treponema sp.]|nr:polyphenol oxidase family protein [Treponema sp.]